MKKRGNKEKRYREVVFLVISLLLVISILFLNKFIGFATFSQDVQADWDLGIYSQTKTDSENVTLLNYTAYSGDWVNQSDGFGTVYASVSNPGGITTNGSDFWITDNNKDFVYHFDANGNNLSGGFNTSENAGSTTPIAIVTNGSDFWVLDQASFVYHFNSNGVNQSDGFGTGGVNLCSNGCDIATNGSDFWVAANNHKFIYHYDSQGNNLSDGFGIGLTNVFGLTTNGSDFWVLEFLDLFIYHFDASGNNLSGGFNISGAGVIYPFGMTNNLVFPKDSFQSPISDFWVVDYLSTNKFVYHFRQENENQVYYSSGNYTSKVFDAGENVKWDNLSWIYDNTSAGPLDLQFRTSNDNINWDGWNGTIENGMGEVNDSSRYFQYQANFSTDDTSYSPYLMNVSLEYSSLDSPTTITLVEPSDLNTSVDFSNVVFNCSAEDNDGLSSMSLYSDYNASIFEFKNISGLSGSYDSYSFDMGSINPLNKFVDTSYIWGCMVNDTNNNVDWSSNGTFASWGLGEYSQTKSDNENVALDINTGWVNQSGGWNPTENGIDDPLGITYNGSDFWVVDFLDKFIYHLGANWNNLSGGFDIGGAGNDGPYGIVTNGSDFWVVDTTDKWVYHFDPNGNNVTDDGFDIGGAGNANPYGITTNGSDFWITDGVDKFVYHYDSSGNNLSDGFNVNESGIAMPYGIVTNGSDFWAVYYADKFVYHYDSSGNNLSDGFDISNAGVTGPWGITTNLVFPRDSFQAPNDFWVVDYAGDFVYHFKEDAYYSSGNYTSKVFDAGENVKWDNLSWVYENTSAGPLDMQFRTSNDNINWDGWNGTIENGMGEVNDSSRYFQYQANFSTDDTSYSPYLQEVNINYSVIDVTAPVISDVIVYNKSEYGINETSIAVCGENLTFNVTVTDDTEISSVWVVIWTTVKEAGNIMWEGFLSLIDSVNNLWGVEIETNASFGSLVNYTIFVNDTLNNTAFYDGNFSIFFYNFTYLKNESDTIAYGYEDGELNNTFYNNSVFGMQLNNGQSSGSYLSRVFDAGENVKWDNLSWIGNTKCGTVTQTFYAGAGDGYVENADAVYSTSRSASSGDTANYGSNVLFVGQVSGGYGIDRAFFPFDTSALGAQAVIVSATFGIFGSTDNSVTNFDYGVVQTTQASTSELVVADYSKCGVLSNPTLGAPVLNTVNYLNGGYNIFTLDSTGRSWINKVGWTKLGVRSAEDYVGSGSAPTTSEYIVLRTSEYSYKPYLEITYYTTCDNQSEIQFRTSNDNINWEGWNGSISNGEGVVNNSARYFQYQVNFSTVDVNLIPKLYNVYINYSSANIVPYWLDFPNNTINITEDIANQNISIGYQDYFMDEEDNQTPINSAIIDKNETDVSCAITTGDIECSPSNNFTGSFIITISGEDSQSSSAMTSFEAFVENVNDIPTGTNGLVNANNTNYSSLPRLEWNNGTDADNDVIYYVLEISNYSDFSIIEYYNGSIEEEVATGDNITGLGEGSYYWRVLASDLTENSSWSDVRYFTYDASGPSIEFINQTNETFDIVNISQPIVSDQNITFNINVTSFLTEVSSVWIVIWETIGESGNVIWEGFMNLVDSTGLWTVDVETNETFGYETNYTIYANDTLNNTVSYDGSFFVIVNTTMDSNYSQYGVEYGDSITVYSYYNYSNGSIIQDGECNVTSSGIYSDMDYNNGNERYENTTFNSSDYSLGENTLNYKCSKEDYLIREIVDYLNISDTIKPLVEIVYPSNGSSNTSSVVNVDFITNDLHSVANCTLYLNGSENATSSSITNDINVNNTFIVENLYEGLIEFNVSCRDNSNNMNMSNVWLNRFVNPLVEYTGDSGYLNKNSTWMNITIVEENLDTIIFAWNNTNNYTYYDGTLSYNKTSLVDGNYSFIIYVNDSSNNENITDEKVIVIDTTNPSSFSLTNPGDGNQSDDNTPLLEWEVSSDDNFDNYTIEIANDSGFSSDSINVTLNSSTNSFSDWESILNNATWHWRVSAWDKAGNNYTSSSYSFTVGEGSATIVTETTTTVTGGGGGGGGTTKVKKGVLDVISPSPLIIYLEDEVRVPLILKNVGNADIKGISLSAEINSEKLSVSFSKSIIDKIIGEGLETIDLIIKSNAEREDIGVYKIDITADVTDPIGKDKSSFYVELTEIGFKEKNDVINQLQIINSLFNQNPECLELNEVVKQAKEAMEKGEYEKAYGLINGAINACKQLVGEEVKEVTIKDRSKLFLILIVNILSAGFVAYLIRRFKKRNEKKGKK